MFLTNQAIITITFVVSVSRSATSPPDYQLANLILMGIYVVLTLVVAIGAIWSVFITRASLKASAKQSQDALAASARQSQAAIDAVHEQIEQSKRQSQDALAVSARQSQAAIDAVHEQIEQSKRQAQLERFAENRPLLMPEGTPTFQSDKPQWLKWDVNEQSLVIHNIGSGAALNVASVMYGCESYLIDWNTNRRSDHEKSIHWTCWLGVPIASNTSEKATHKIGNGNFYENKMHIGRYSFNAPPEPRTVPHQSQPFITARITITYLDIFRRKHASIFDYVQHTGGWQLVEFLEDITDDLHDLEGL